MALNSARGSPKVDNARSGKAAKIEIRRNILAAIGAGEAHVFDAFAGAGQLYRAVWHEAASYVGCDQRYFADERKMFVADNRRVLRAIDLAAFNVFDLDAYGAPWEQAVIITARRQLAEGERMGMVFTEGDGLAYNGNVVPRAVAELVGINGKVVGFHRRRDQVQGWIINAIAARMQGVVEKRWQAGKVGGTAVNYIGIVVSGAARSAAGLDNRGEGISANPS